MRLWSKLKNRRAKAPRATAVTERRRPTGAEVDRQQLRRMKVMGGLLIGGFATVMVALLNFQGCNHALYRDQAEANYLRTLRMSTQRGDILDRKGEALATSVDVDTVYVNPKKLAEELELQGKTLEETARQVAHVLSMTPDAVERAFRAEARFRYVKRQVTTDEAERVKRLEIPGLYIQQEAKRFYPKKELAGQVLGVVGFDSIGVEGIESAYESALRGGSVSTRYHRDSFGHYEMTEGLPDVAAEAGHTLKLTIDEKIQAVAETELERAVVSFLARSGMAVVMEVQTGDILAAAHYPRFNPNRYLEIVPSDTQTFQLQSEVISDLRKKKRKGEPVDEEAFQALRMHTMVPRHRNRVMSNTFEPGSTFKVFTLAAAIEQGVVGLSDRFDVSEGRIKVDKKWVRDTHRIDKPDATVTELVKHSSNVGFIKIGQILGAELFHDAILRFGFGRPTGVGVGGDAGGRVPALKEFGLVVSANVAFGQGISVTPLQLTSALAALGNGGLLMKPRLVLEERAGDGTVIERFEPEAVRRVVSAATARSVIKALESVVDSDGTGHDAWLYDHDVAGKTGTAQKVDPIVGGYSEEHWTSSFIGLVPSKSPRLAIAIIVDEPKGLHYGGRVAAPAFRTIAEFALRYLEVPPTYGPRERVAREEVRRRHGQPEPTGLDPAAEGAIFDDDEEAAVAGEALPKSVTVPDFTDLGVANAVRAAHKRLLAVQVDGSGTVSAQSVAAGTKVPPWTTVTLYFRPGDDAQTPDEGDEP